MSIERDAEIWKKFAKKTISKPMKAAAASSNTDNKIRESAGTNIPELADGATEYTKRYDDGLVFHFNISALNDPSHSLFNGNNPYGYQINISHPAILPLYRSYQAFTKCNILSDSDRADFEKRVIAELSKMGIIS